jgi:hypothetical protein
VILAAQHLVGAAALAETARHLQTSGARIAFGGRIFNVLPALRERIPARFLGETLEEALAEIETLGARPAPVRTPIAASPALAGCLSAFRAARPAIEAALGAPTQHIETANRFFGDGLTAALALGDPAYLEPELDWMAALLDSRRADPERLKDYLKRYADAIRERLGRTGASLSKWLDAYIVKMA